MEFICQRIKVLMRALFQYLFPFLIAGCIQQENMNNITSPSAEEIPRSFFKQLNDIPPPNGFKRVNAASNSFTTWLRKLPLKKDKTVYLYNGSIKANQSAQFAVVDISTGKTDLQQCADVVMRLRAEYLFAQKKYDSIRFMDYNRKWYNWKGTDNRKQFDSYLQLVFGWCGSASLEKQLKQISNFNHIQPGDVLIKGGFPGHAMIVADMAVNAKGQKVFMLIQGYQPAQDVHIVINPIDSSLSPWYSVNDANEIITPEWTFYKYQLYEW